MTEYYELGNAVIDSDDSEIYPETRDLIKACKNSPHVTFCELRQNEQGGFRTDHVIIEAGNGEVAKRNPGNICRIERLAISVNPALRIPISVRTLRKDFPALSHQHGWTPGTPRTLCLYDVAWTTVERTWTAERFLNRIFWWLRESAELKLHRDDQPLEQLFYSSPYQLILPANHSQFSQQGGGQLTLQTVDDLDGHTITLKAVPAKASHSVLPFRLLTLSVAPVEASVVVMYPDTLGGLHDLLAQWGSDLLSDLRASIENAMPPGAPFTVAEGGEGTLVLVSVPRKHHETIVGSELKGYMIKSSLLDLAKTFDIVGVPDTEGRYFRAHSLMPVIKEHWRSIRVLPVEVRTSLDASFARKLSAVDPQTADFNGVLAGLGALGSTLASIWLRAGWGHWTFIDPDQLMPHNIPRHMAFDCHVGYRKADVLKAMAKEIYPQEPPVTAIVGSVIDDGDDLSPALQNGALLVDVTTTLEVPRELARQEDVPRTASLFLTPSGNGCVMLLEDAARQQRVDALEAQYYRALIDNEWGRSHLANHLGDLWVGGGCRDISLRMSGEFIHLHAGILSRQLRQATTSDAARLCVWEACDKTGGVSAYEVPVHEVVSEQGSQWRVQYDLGLLQKLQGQRSAALPNETGGAIVGITDFKSKTIILVDVLPTPPDSQSSPTHFIRGKEGQAQALENVQQRTARVVSYIGEWHSHPDGFSATPSSDDKKLLASISAEMSDEGLPAVMAIVSASEFKVYVQQAAGELPI